MPSHILAEVEVFDPHSCDIISHTGDGWTLTDVSRSGLGGKEGEVVDEFTLRGDPNADLPSTETDRIERVFSFENEHIFRISRPATQQCACQRIESEGCVVQTINGDEESLALSFLVEDTQTLRTVVEELEETAETVSLRRLVEGNNNLCENTPTVLDVDALTARQEETLEVAYEMGYFEKPRDATAGEVAEELDIATTTFTEHLAAAQRKLLKDLVSG